MPGWRRGRGEGWLTAEYAMLPRATSTRTSRERGQLGGRTQEIQRLIGRSVRAMLDDFALGEYTLKIDCDVLAGRRRHADGSDHRRMRRARRRVRLDGRAGEAQAVAGAASRRGGERRRRRRRAATRSRLRGGRRRRRRHECRDEQRRPVRRSAGHGRARHVRSRASSIGCSISRSADCRELDARQRSALGI